MYKYIHKTNYNSLTQIVFGDNQFFSARRNLKSTLSLRALLQAENQSWETLKIPLCNETQ